MEPQPVAKPTPTPAKSSERLAKKAAASKAAEEAEAAEVDGEVRERLKEAAEAEVAAAVECEVRASGSARDAACLPFGVVGELRRKLGPIALAVLLLVMGAGMMYFGFRQSFRGLAPAVCCCILPLLGFRAWVR
eukprot:COSAG04_NODE_17036_length_481_cov_0.926702_1_plen_134_part_00